MVLLRFPLSRISPLAPYLFMDRPLLTPEHLRAARYEVAAMILAGVALLLALTLDLLPALLAGLLVYELVHILAPTMRRHLSSQRAKLLTVVILSTAIITAVTLSILAAIAFFRSEAGSVPALLKKMAEIIEGARATLPPVVTERLPVTTEELREASVRWLREHASTVQLMGREAARGFVHVLIGMVVGALIALHEAAPIENYKPLARALAERAARLGDAFRRVVFAQVLISATNTLFTSIYLVFVLPLFGVELPFIKTLIAVTFIAGLLPIFGNIISNTVIVVVSLSYSLLVAGSSLAFLVIIHKLEYFLNAHIVGTQIKARAWELLIMMLLFEAAFGVAGLVAAPIYYAYLKDELAARRLI